MAIAARNQPQGLVRLNRSNPIANRASALITASADRNIVGNAALTIAGSVPRSVISSGKAFAFAQAGYVETAVLQAIGIGSYVEIWHGVPDTTTIGAKGNSAEPKFLTGSNTNQVGLFQTPGGQEINKTGNSGWGVFDTWANCYPSPDVLVGGKRVTLLAIRRQGTLEYWRDGALVGGPYAIAGGNFSIPASSMILGSFIRDTGFWASSSQTAFAARIPGEITADQARALSANPWQLFDAPSQTQFPQIAATGGTGANATATPSGVSVSSAVGSATASGTAKAAPLGVAAAASVGTVAANGTTVVNGTATPLGVSAAASVGTATAQGAASSTAQPAGVAASAAVGTASASGQAKAAPAGVSATSAVGTAVATGQAITYAFPAGVQAVASVGIATGKGAATAAPLGVQSQIFVGVPYAYGPFDASSYPQVYATTLMRLDTISRNGGILRDTLARQSAMRDTQAASSLMRASAINLTSAMRSDPINRTANLL